MVFGVVDRFFAFSNSVEIAVSVSFHNDLKTKVVLVGLPAEDRTVLQNKASSQILISLDLFRFTDHLTVLSIVSRIFITYFTICTA